jgi:hypothetical protein
VGENDIPIIRPRRSWGKDRWEKHYNRMPWVTRRLADLIGALSEIERMGIAPGVEG